MTRTRFALINAIVTTIAIASVAPVAAQDRPADTATRAQQAADQRSEKSGRLSPPRRSAIERGLQWYDDHGMRLGWKAFHFTGGGFPQGAGFGYGIGISAKAVGSSIVDDDQPNRVDADFTAARSLRGYQRMAARIDIKNASGGPLDLSVRWLDYRSPQEDFYGLGPDSLASQRSNYGVDGSEVGGGIAWRATDSLTIGGELAYLTTVMREGTDTRFATTQSMFDESNAPGLTEVPQFLRANAALGYDWRDSDTHPRRGGNYTATFSNYYGVDADAFNFRRLDVSAQQIVPLPNRSRRIELRAAAAFTEASSGCDVPFIYQPRLGGTNVLRGYSESRFRDRNAVWASAEYQWEAWWALDAALFVDAGQVAARRSDLSLRNFELTYGIGFRLHGDGNFIARLDLARSREGFHPILGFKYGF